jgi:hypothetical protein
MDEPVQLITIRVNANLTLGAGAFSSVYDEKAQRTVYTVTPPGTPLLEQLLTYLDSLPKVRYTDPHSRHLGLGLTALAIRWGTYLATLMDEATAFHPSIPARGKQSQPQEISYLTNTEMRRLNIEVSYNLARLGRYCRESRQTFYDRLAKAYANLPMPLKTIQPNAKVEQALIQAYQEGTLRLALKRNPAQLAQFGQIFKAQVDPAQIPLEPVASADADRVIGNFLARLAWRDTVVEDYHAGKRSEPGLLPHQRRFSYRDERLLLGALSGNMLILSRRMDLFFCAESDALPMPAALAVRYPETATALYNSLGGAYYPRDWSLTESSAVVTL